MTKRNDYPPGSVWANDAGRKVVVMGTTAGDENEPPMSTPAGPRPALYVHYRDYAPADVKVFTSSEWFWLAVNKFTHVAGVEVPTAADSIAYRCEPLIASVVATIAGRPPVLKRQQAIDALNAARKTMCGNACDEAMAYFMGLVGAFAMAGTINREDYRLFVNEVDRCPGHEPSASWCSYCGSISHTKEDGCDHE